MVDHYIFGDCERISPEAPVPIVDLKSEKYTLGGAGNVIENLAAFGAKIGLVSVCGKDEGLDIINNEFNKLKAVNYKMIIDESRRTTIKTRVISNKHQLLRVDRENKHYIDAGTSEKIIAEITENIDQIKIVIISDYCKGVMSEETIVNVISLCRQNNVKVIVDSKDPILSKYKNANVIKPNKKEASIATGIKINDDDTLKKACQKITELTNCDSVVITLSEEGMAFFNEGILTKIPTKALEVFDVTGAGDTVIAAIAFALLHELDLSQACDFANHAAAVVVAKVGSATATLDEIDYFYSKN